MTDTLLFTCDLCGKKYERQSSERPSEWVLRIHYGSPVSFKYDTAHCHGSGDTTAVQLGLCSECTCRAARFMGLELSTPEYREKLQVDADRETRLQLERLSERLSKRRRSKK